MTGEEGLRVIRCLSFHADYKCRNTGICCSSGWEVAVETTVESWLVARLSSPGTRLPHGPDGFRPAENPPTGCQSAFRRYLPNGSCWFRDPDAGLCAIHREFGEESLASACRHFPRVCVLEPGVVAVSLSHYCPTATAALFRSDPAFCLVEGPDAFPATWPFEGLDATSAYPPFLRPGVLLGFDGLRTFEAAAVAALAEGDLWGGLGRIERAVAAFRVWTPGAGPLNDLIRSSFSDSVDVPVHYLPFDPRGILIASATAGASELPDLPAFEGGVPRLSARVDLALRRYLAARLIAAWIIFQANDMAALPRYLRLCLDVVLLFERTQAESNPEEKRWTEAIRNADLWILHQCDPELLARNLG